MAKNRRERPIGEPLPPETIEGRDLPTEAGAVMLGHAMAAYEQPEQPPDQEAGQEAEQEIEGPPRWRVALRCPTPLAHASLEVEAISEAEAKAKFCQANGISDSVHDWTIERLS